MLSLRAWRRLAITTLSASPKPASEPAWLETIPIRTGLPVGLASLEAQPAVMLETPAAAPVRPAIWRKRRRSRRAAMLLPAGPEPGPERATQEAERRLISATNGHPPGDNELGGAREARQRLHERCGAQRDNGLAAAKSRMAQMTRSFETAHAASRAAGPATAAARGPGPCGRPGSRGGSCSP